MKCSFLFQHRLYYKLVITNNNYLNMKTKYWTKIANFEGLPKLSDFKVVEEEVDENLKPGEIITEALVVSVDPFIRAYTFPPGIPIIGFQTSKVLKSANEKYPKGSIVMYTGGWKTICKTNAEDIWSRVDAIEPKVELTHSIGAVGMPGLTAYFGLLELCKPKEGETVFVNGCSGAVGSLVGQIAKIKSCKVVGCCGTDEKVKFAKSIGFDDAFNYKTEKSWPEALKRIAPNGIDCFFDNVGGQLASDVMNHMNKFGRVAVCGCISSYNSTSKPKVEILQPIILFKELCINGFLVRRWMERFPEGFKQMSQWISEGKIKVRETTTTGFDNLPKAFIGMLSGENTGKAVVRM